MKICFQAIFAKTIFFHSISRKLEAAGHDIYWTATSRKWTNWLVSQGVDRSRILLIERHSLLKESTLGQDTIELINRIETEYGLPLKTVYYMDRIICNWSWDEARGYMAAAIGKLARFLDTHEIDIVIGEATSADEVLSAAVCRLTGIAFYHPGTARIPSDRFLFFKDHLQERFQSFETNLHDQTVLEQADQVRENVISGAKPNYWYWNNKIPTFNPGFFKKIGAKVHEALVEARSDATVKSLKYHLTRQRQYLKPFRHIGLKLRPVFDRPVSGEKFVLYTLHKQPEASVDVFGADFSNQPHLIRQIARHLPSDTWLYVKEHSNCIGDRTRRELRHLRGLPGVRLIDPHVEVHELIRSARAVLTVSGTVAFEAALYGKPTGTFSKMYFSGFSSVRHMKTYRDIESLMTGSDQAGWTESDRHTLAHIIANSHEGVIGDPLSTPVCMLDENIEQVAEGIEKLSRRLEGEGTRCKTQKPRVTLICDSHGAGYGTVGFAEILSRKLSRTHNIRCHTYGGLAVKDILQRLIESGMPQTDIAVIQVGNPDVHPRMPIRPLRAMRSLGMNFFRDSLFSIPPKLGLRYFLRFPFFLIRVAIIRFHQEFLVSTDDLKKDFDRLIEYVSGNSSRVILMPIYHVHPRIYTSSHNNRADEVNRYLADKYPDMFVQPRILRPKAYQHYYNKDGFHYICRYHERVASWLQNMMDLQFEGRHGLKLKRVAPANQPKQSLIREEVAV